MKRNFISLFGGIQNDEEWRLFYCDSTFYCDCTFQTIYNSTLGWWVIQDFDLCKLDDLWRHNVDEKQNNYGISVRIQSLQGWNRVNVLQELNSYYIINISAMLASDSEPLAENIIFSETKQKVSVHLNQHGNHVKPNMSTMLNCIFLVEPFCSSARLFCFV